MELKLDPFLSDCFLYILLIVPYGIETSAFSAVLMEPDSLLIVPYGIETCMIANRLKTYNTFNRTLWN